MYRPFLPLCLIASPVFAEVPQVVTDIPPVHGLVARVMDGLGEPVLLLEAGADPHHASLRPSGAAALEGAALVIWMGEGLTPWLHDPIETLATEAHVITLLEAPGTALLEFREGAQLHHGDEHEDHEEHEDDHAEHDEDEDHAEHDDHDDEHEDHAGHDHDHGDSDPHAWLDPHNAEEWLTLISEELAELDPENGAQYLQNASDAAAEIEALEEGISARLAPLADHSFVAAHDSWQYFEGHFGLSALGALTDSDAADPGPARLAELAEILAEEGPACIIVEPGMNLARLNAISPDGAVPLVEIDPLGRGLPAGAGHYAALLTSVADGFEACLSGGH